MLKGLSLVELATKIEALKTQKKDFIVDTASQLEMVPTPNATGTSLVVAGQGSFPIRPIAHRQIGTRLSIPAPYYDRMLKDQPDLLATNVNRWFKAEPDKRMIRTISGQDRAFLSNAYQRVENEEIASVVLPILMNTPGMQITSCEVTERRMYIQAVNTNIQRELKTKRVGDVVQSGVTISNSEVGEGSVAVSELDWYLACLNGMIASKLMRASHVGRRVEDNEALWAEDTRKADDKALVLKVRDMVNAAMDAARFNARMDKVQGLTEAKITGDLQASVEVLGQKIGATQEETGSILKALIEGGDLSGFGMLQAVTAQAHTALSYDRAVEFEHAGGVVLNLNKAEWREVLEADKAPVRALKKAA
jgi:hypothetical protein